MNGLKSILLSSVAAISLAAGPAVTQQVTPGADQPAGAVTDRSYDTRYGEQFAEWGDQSIGELIGTEVVNDVGETIGEIDNFGLAGESLVAVIGVGGFLGMGEHDVAVPIEEFTRQDNQLVLAGVTREQLEAMPEYDSAEAPALAGEQTLRTGYEAGPVPMTDTAAMTETPAADGALEEASEDMAQAAEEADAAVEEAGEEMAQDAGEAVEPATVDAQNEMADADAADAPLVTDEEEAVEARTDSDRLDEPVGADAQTIEAENETGWTEEMDTIFADIADREIAELIGMQVASADGDVVGEIDNFALEGQDVVAIVGVGGFLGIGEHDVALPLTDMTYDGERLVLSSLTEEQLRQMPEYEADEANRLPQDGSLRSTYNQ